MQRLPGQAAGRLRTAASAPSRSPLMAAVAAEQREPLRSLSVDG